MNLTQYRPTSPGRRHRTDLESGRTTEVYPVKRLTRALKSKAGRNNSGQITIRHRGGGHKRRLRLIDWKRDKRGIPGIVSSLEYDPNRTAIIALIHYPDGDRRYILAPEGLKVGDQVEAGATAEIKIGSALPLKSIPVGTPIHNLELTPGKGSQLVRTAGQQALIQSQEGQFATVLLPSKQQRLIRLDCYATIGQVSNSSWRAVSLGKAGRGRHAGRRPHVRGVAMHPAAHPHGGGEGRSGIGMTSPKSPWGKPTLGRKTRSKTKYSNRYVKI